MKPFHEFCCRLINWIPRISVERCVLTLLVLSFANLTYALPFLVGPKSGTTLPTQAGPFGVHAYYTVENNTPTALNDNFVKYLPPNVTQIIVGGTFPDTCGATFNFTPKLQPGSSCTLELLINGPVNGADPDPHHHLFICLPDGKTCAGTPSPLNVIGGVTTFSFAYIINANNSLTICSLDSTGTNLSSCTSHSSGTFSIPTSLAVTPNGKFVYISNYGDSSISVCPIIGNGENIGTCVKRKPSIFNPNSIAIDNMGKHIYIANFISLSICTIDQAMGTVGACHEYSSLGTTEFDSVTLNADNTRIYVGTSFPNIIICPLDAANGTINPRTCHIFGDTATIQTPIGINFNANGTKVYVTNFDFHHLMICTVNATTGMLSDCTTTDGNGTFDFNSNPTRSDLLMGSSLNVGYIPNGGNDTLSICPINPNGSLGTCKVSNAGGTLGSPSGIALR